MKEIKDIIGAYDTATTKGLRTALATVVHVDGSSYRRPGARMLITEEGNLTGAISGGCLEGDALRKALLVITGNKPLLVTYDTNDEDDAKFGMGLGCNGIIQVLIEPIDNSNQQNPINLLKKATQRRKESVIITLFSLQDRRAQQPGTCVIINFDEIISSAGVMLEDEMLSDGKNTLQEKKSQFKNYTSDKYDLIAFIEFLALPISLVIAGAGNDIIPVTQLAEVLGWQITIVDGRAHLANENRFSSSCQVLTVKPEEVLQRISIDDRTAFALMTHNYNYDMALMRELINRNAKYIGLLGPKKKRDRMLQELTDSGLQINDQQMACIFGPVGLNIGAETPEEIALSIISEIQSIFSGKDASSLKINMHTIHDRFTTVSRSK